MMNIITQIVLYLVILVLLGKPLGKYMAKVYEGEKVILSPVLTPIENFIYRLIGTEKDHEMNWKEYLKAVVMYSVFGFLFVFFIQKLQGILPFNPEKLGSVPSDLAFNTAMSFTTNTNWQAYGGETTLSYFAQMAGLTVQNFISAAGGMSVLFALIRGFSRKETTKIGNFWTDMVRGTLYVLLPLSIILTLMLVSQGVVQNLKPYQQVSLMEPVVLEDGSVITTQTIAVGPAASQIAIKQLGTNGGGFFSVNSAHPLENPTPLSNLLEMLALLLIPLALCFSFGYLVKDMRQGRAIFIAMMIVFVLCLASVVTLEQIGTPQLSQNNQVDLAYSMDQSGGNMEGKEVRFGIVNSSIWATATTAASNGSVNSMHDSYTPLGGLPLMLLMQLGEVIFGGVGSGLYGMLSFVIVAVFVAGLMVGRTPEYLGKKIEPFEMKMASLAVLIPPAVVLIGTAMAAVNPGVMDSLNNPGPHGFSEILYAYSSAGNNNGSAFAGFNANTVFLNITLGIAMMLARFGPMLPMIAIAGSLAKKKTIPVTSGTLVTHNTLFIGLLIAVVLMVGALSFFPALALGPLVEHLQMIFR
ncbi:K+-transporting ATPase ATPase A chain [Anaerosolibacter carboniphilus]|uniref:Potassium-transporting ATPase potassium-binding subunit n=1 Tax=Anaerosolibacter carboniphilus TaxID=1417629 RepID=A0A841KVG0_9FIRM|nr:potassium-transporting ATPase subunit KdpA [Anaerosolibacter carboniphilus]MBB6214175.1 K+-transporting ATPase ATPase A chain [Anaerosolibacter carboniphilus]